ncbi:ATP-binding protein [uncultured Sphaerochaeta sp.]|uniref:ATP-binding protein n=1 Tax=uncultured Sphaerochaeta sp. TaxID=886478 RepID=UPI002A0A4504|nr:ATP-binding protein [uncultured Sphaerochaeta sp.]
MKQLLLLSGKGGTGKTTVASAFIDLLKAKAYADCDVDAPNLHLIHNHFPSEQDTDYFSFPKAKIDEKICIDCGKCMAACRFDAIHRKERYTVDSLTCEGCKTCTLVCPVSAISMQEAKAGELHLFADAQSVFSTATLKMGSGTTGKLVTKVKEQLKKNAPKTDIAIIDGSPGIGCPVIASLAGVDLVLIVAEPSVSGVSDMLRIIQTASQFQVKVVVCINKYDTNVQQSALIEAFCWKKEIPFMGKIPFDKEAIKAINQGKTIVEVDCDSGLAVRSVFDNTMHLLKRST